MQTRHNAIIGPHEEFAGVYEDLYIWISKRLRKILKSWLITAVGEEPENRIVLARDFWNVEKWSETDIGWAIGELAQHGTPADMAQTVCWFLAIQSEDTVRAVLPIKNGQLLRENIRLIRNQQADITDIHCLKTMHATINISFALQRAAGTLSDPHEGLLMAALATGKPLYWGDVRTSGNGCPLSVTIEGRKTWFVSGARESERHLGMASVLYVPLQVRNDGQLASETGTYAATTTPLLALYSPIPHIFGFSSRPKLYPIEGQFHEIWTQITEQPFMALIRSLALNDCLLGPDGARISAQSALTSVEVLRQRHQDLLDWMVEICKDSREVSVSLDAQQIGQILARLVSTYFPNLTGTKGPEMSIYLRDECTAKEIETNSMADNTQFRPETRGGNNPRLIFDAFNATVPRHLQTLRRETEITWVLLTHLIRNALRYGPTEIELSWRPRNDRWWINVANEVSVRRIEDYQDLLRAYWIVRHSHLRQEQGNRGTFVEGFGLYATAFLCWACGLRFVPELQLPNGFPAKVRWSSGIGILRRTVK